MMRVEVRMARVSVTGIGLWVVTAMACAAALRAQPAQQAAIDDPSLESARRAKVVLDAGIAALGGLPAIQGIERFSLTERGTQGQIGQAMTPAPPFSAIAMDDTTHFDRRRRRVYVSLSRRYSWGPFEQVGFVNGAEGFTLDNQARRARPIAAADQQAYHDRARRLPQLVLLAALDRAYSLRDVGEASFDRRPHRVISADLGANQVFNLYFDRATNLLTKMQYLYPDSLFGDALDETIFSGYRPLNGLTVPSARLVRRGGHEADKVEYVSLTINQALDDTRFAVPAGYQIQPAETRPRHAVTRLAKDVYVLEQANGLNSNVSFIAFNDYILVVEAPAERIERGLSDSVIQTIRETVPNKPIRYVVPTHHHVDHGAGLRSYIAEGTTVVTTPGNAAFVRQLAGLRFAIRPDALTLGPRAPAIETIDNRQRTFRDEAHVVELHDVGPESHVQETVAAWLPNERILIIGDLYESGYAETVTWDGKGNLGDILSRHKWDVETVVSSHSRPRRLADLRSPR
jgi:glyoxylase-like metal-dependent hydrolase (beta-lactamase superfamily II)